jgi:hypothetical protein
MQKVFIDFFLAVLGFESRMSWTLGKYFATVPGPQPGGPDSMWVKNDEKSLRSPCPHGQSVRKMNCPTL